MRKLKLGEIIDSISITHKFNKEKLIFLNTSDVLDGKILKQEFFNVKELKGQAKKTIRYRDILFSEIRPKNKRFAFVNIKDTDDYVVSTKLMVLRNKLEDVLTEYIYYFLTYEGTLNYLQMRAENRIGSFPQITFDILKPISLIVPNIQKQKNIVNVIKSIDDKIEVLNQLNDNLAQLAKTIYDYWFVQFDFPDENGKPYKSSGGKMVYNEILKREIPEGWEVKKLGDIETNIITGKTPSTKDGDNFGGIIPFITIDDIRQQLFIYKTERTLSEKGADFQKSKYLQKGDICVSCIGTVGVIGIVGEKSQTNQQINSISNPSYNNRYFLLNYLKQYFQDNFTAKKGAVLDNMNKAEFESIIIINPHKSVKDTYHKVVKNMYKNIDINIQQIHHLQILRDTLLPMLMNGQIEVE